MFSISPSDVVKFLQDAVNNVTGSGDTASPDTVLLDLGMDSLGAVEFRNIILETTGVKLPQSITFDNPTLIEPASYLLRRVGRNDLPDPDFIPIDTDIIDLNHASLKLDVMEWLQSVFEDGERHLLYSEAFLLRYKALFDLVKDDDFDGSLSEMNIHGADRDNLFVSQDQLRHEVFKREVNAGGSVLGADNRSCDPHPTDDVHALKLWVKERFSTELGNIEDYSNKNKIALLTGATGFVGRLQLIRLCKEYDHVYALVRCKNEDDGVKRIENALEEADEDEEFSELMKKTTVLPGDFSKEQLGLNDPDWRMLCSNIDMIYHTGGDVNLVSGYLRMISTNTLSLKNIIKLATTVKKKAIHFTSTLGQFPEFFGAFCSEFNSLKVTEDSVPDLDRLEKYYPPRRQGYAWSKWAAEEVLREASYHGLICAIYRLPNTYVSYRKGYTNIADYASALTISSIEEGVFPLTSPVAALTPADQIVDILVRLSLKTRKHLVYHLFDPRTLTYAHLYKWAESLGLKYEGIPCDEFFDTVKAIGPSSPVFKFVPLMQYWRQYWFDSAHRDSPFPITTDHVDEDLGEKVIWPELRELFKRSFLYCARRNWFHTSSKKVYPLTLTLFLMVP